MSARIRGRTDAVADCRARRTSRMPRCSEKATGPGRLVPGHLQKSGDEAADGAGPMLPPDYITGGPLLRGAGHWRSVHAP